MNRITELVALNLITEEQKKRIDHLVLGGKIMPNSFVNYPDNENLLSVLVSFLEDHLNSGILILQSFLPTHICSSFDSDGCV